MKVSLKWLAEYVKVPADLKALCDRLDLTGTGVEGIERLGASFDNVVTGQIVAKDAHPDSDHLWVTKVDVGSANLGEDGSPLPLQIVCGAQNFNAGDHVVVALVGSVLPNGAAIKKSKLRGVESCGMNCSARELGLGEDHAGIMILPADAPLGMPFADYAGKGDTVLDLEITPNRPDCLSVVGLAREMGAIFGEDVTLPAFDLVESADPAAGYVDIEVTQAERCPRYTARVITGVKVGPSPDWLVERISALGARPINNIVDVTNYIQFLLGQPLHAFDFDSLKGADGKAHIVVRPAGEGEKFTTLDKEERTLKSDMTVIATPERAVALAGVMGGLDSEVTEATTTVLLEAATFSPAHTSRTSRNLGLISEASMRYERRVDDNAIAFNSAFAAALMAEVSGGSVCAGMADAWPVKSEPVKLSFRIGRFNAMMGANIPREAIVDTLVRLGCTVDAAKGEAQAEAQGEAQGGSEGVDTADVLH
ncbi:MAG: phenylalanine--tRNA ligase subunit beta, partial [Eggerthellaceae bacterium]|nr:phenylalanine--tRNA ligase subunit beta [Eggerthellaceae bacterium]